MAENEKIDEVVLDLIAIENQKRVLKEQIEDLEKQEDEIKERVIGFMKLNSQKILETDEIRIAYIEETSRETIDSAKLKREYPDVANNCRKITTIKENWKLTLKENK